MKSTMNIDISRRINLKIEFPRLIITPFCILTEKTMGSRLYVLILPFTIFTLEIHKKLSFKDKDWNQGGGGMRI